jgi:hypothetical protein
MLACKLVLAVLLTITTYGAAAVTPDAWTTLDLKATIGLIWVVLLLFWFAYWRIVRFDPDSK